MELNKKMKYFIFFLKRILKDWISKMFNMKVLVLFNLSNSVYSIFSLQSVTRAHPCTLIQIYESNAFYGVQIFSCDVLYLTRRLIVKSCQFQIIKEWNFFSGLDTNYKNVQSHPKKQNKKQQQNKTSWKK